MQINSWWWAIPKICGYLISRFYSNCENLMLAKYTFYSITLQGWMVTFYEGLLHGTQWSITITGAGFQLCMLTHNWQTGIRTCLTDREAKTNDLVTDLDRDVSKMNQSVPASAATLSSLVSDQSADTSGVWPQSSDMNACNVTVLYMRITPFFSATMICPTLQTRHDLVSLGSMRQQHALQLTL